MTLNKNVIKMLAHLSEEAGEVSQACGKFMRFEREEDVLEIFKEVGDLIAVATCLGTELEIGPADKINKQLFKKLEKYSKEYFIVDAS